ncbi:MAG TPA: Rossmann-like and DUF2520 domain-containing protein [Ignavibacteria bacterium]
MKDIKNLTICIIGSGKVGSALTFELVEKGFKVRYLVSRNLEHLQKIAKSIINIAFSDKLEIEFIKKSDIIIICIQDKFIYDFVSKLKNTGLNYYGKFIFHTSGFLSSDVFKNVKISKNNIGSFHPVQTFNKISFKKSNLFKGIYWGIEAGNELRKVLINISRALNSNYILIPKKDKHMYHFACVYSSNFLVTYLKILDTMISDTKIKPIKNIEIFLPIIRQTLNNIEQNGFSKSLTGPFVRKDFRIIEGHLKYLKKNSPEIIPLYLCFGKCAIDISSINNPFSNSELSELEKIFKKYNNNLI